MPQVKVSSYLIEKYGTKKESENSMVALAKRLVLKHAAMPATLPSAPGPETSEVKIPKNPIPVFEVPSPVSALPPVPELDSGEIPTPQMNVNLPPMSLEMSNQSDPQASGRPTLPPGPDDDTRRFSLKDYMNNAIERMQINHAITPLHKSKLLQKLNKTTSDAESLEIWHEAKKDLDRAVKHATEYAELMRQQGNEEEYHFAWQYIAIMHNIKETVEKQIRALA